MSSTTGNPSESESQSAWRYRARKLIQSVHFETPSFKVPTYVRDPSAPHHQQGYRPLYAIPTNSDEARAVLKAEMTRAEAILVRTQRISAYLGIEEEFHDMMDAVRCYGETPPE